MVMSAQWPYSLGGYAGPGKLLQAQPAKPGRTQRCTTSLMTGEAGLWGQGQESGTCWLTTRVPTAGVPDWRRRQQGAGSAGPTDLAALIELPCVMKAGGAAGGPKFRG